MILLDFVGVLLGQLKNRIPIVIDGFIASAAALLCTKAKSIYTSEFMFPSHLSAEPGAAYMMKKN